MGTSRTPKSHRIRVDKIGIPILVDLDDALLTPWLGAFPGIRLTGAVGSAASPSDCAETQTGLDVVVESTTPSSDFSEGPSDGDGSDGGGRASGAGRTSSVAGARCSAVVVAGTVTPSEPGRWGGEEVGPSFTSGANWTRGV